MERRIHVYRNSIFKDLPHNFCIRDYISRAGWSSLDILARIYKDMGKTGLNISSHGHNFSTALAHY